MQPISLSFILFLSISSLLQGAFIKDFIAKLNDEARHINGRLQFTLEKKTAWISLPEIGKCDGWVFNMNRSKPFSSSVNSISSKSESTINDFPRIPDEMKHPRNSKHHLLQWIVNKEENLCIYTDDPLTGAESLKNFFQSVIYDRVEPNKAFKTFKHGIQMDEGTGLHAYAWKTKFDCGLYNLGTPEQIYDQTGLVEKLAKSESATATLGPKQDLFSVQIADLTVNIPGNSQTPLYLIRLSKGTAPESAPLHLKSHYTDLNELYRVVFKSSYPDYEFQSNGRYPENTSINLMQSSDFNSLIHSQIPYLKALRSIYEDDGFVAVRLEALRGNSEILKIFPETVKNDSLNLLVWKGVAARSTSDDNDNISMTSELTCDEPEASVQTHIGNYEPDSDDELSEDEDFHAAASNEADSDDEE